MHAGGPRERAWKLRRQLSVYSPIPASAVVRATAAALGLLSDARPGLNARLKEEFRAEDCQLFGSGTQALQAALVLARATITDSAAIAIPAFSCFDVASAAIGAGGPVMLYDLDPITLAPEPGSLERVLAAGGRVVVIAPLYGIPVPWDALEALAVRHDALLIEDASQGHGATWDDRPVGSLGRVSTLSFGRGKGWTGGNGGALLTRGGSPAPTSVLDEAPLRRELSTVVGLAAQHVLGRPALFGIPHAVPGLHLGETTYKDPVRPMAITRAAATALAQTAVLSGREVARRRDNTEALLALVKGRTRLCPITIPAQGVAGYLRLPVLVTEGAARLETPAVAALGVLRSYPVVLGELPQIADRVTGPVRKWPGAQRLVRELFTLPVHSMVQPREREAIAALFR